MVKHYRTYDNTYLCMPMIKPNPNKMVMCISDCDCNECKIKMVKYLNDINKMQKSPVMPFNHIQTTLKDVV